MTSWERLTREEKPSYWAESEALLKDLLTACSPFLTESEREWVHDLIDHNEHGVALEFMFDYLVEEPRNYPEELLAQFRQAATRLPMTHGRDVDSLMPGHPPVMYAPMSHTYDLLCVDCADAVPLGKMVNQSEVGQPIPWKLTGWRDAVIGRRIPGGGLSEVVTLFLSHHRRHELRVIPEALLDWIDPDNRLWGRDSVAELLERPVDPEPDDEADAAALSPDLVERLKTRIAQLPLRY